MGYEQEWRPEHCRSNGEMVLQVACASAILRFRIPVFIAMSFSKAFISELVVAGEIEFVLDQGSTSVGVITHAIAADPGIQQRKGQNKNDEQAYFEQALRGFEWRMETHPAVRRRYATTHTTPVPQSTGSVG